MSVPAVRFDAPEPRLTATIESGTDSVYVTHVWVAYGSSGYRIALPRNLAARLVEVVNAN